MPPTIGFNDLPHELKMEIVACAYRQDLAYQCAEYYDFGGWFPSDHREMIMAELGRSIEEGGGSDTTEAQFTEGGSSSDSVEGQDWEMATEYSLDWDLQIPHNEYALRRKSVKSLALVNKELAELCATHIFSVSCLLL